MKKLVLALVAASLMLVGCGNKESITASTFTSTMEEKGFEVADVAEQYEDEEIKNVVIAMNEDYQVEFYVFSTEDRASAVFAGNKDTIESLSSGNSVNTSVSMGNFATYSLTTSENYYIVSRIGNTVMYANVGVAHKDAVSSIISEFGYK